MAQKKAQEPRPDWGFYAMTPRIVRTQYKDLSHTEKWLYTCLKDLCGDKGSCFRSLRALEEETDISTGSLSKMIPHLHNEGLIHAEKKRRSKSGKEVWHISIIDIWQANAKYCKDCSKIEQSQEGTTEVVQNMNNNVPVCSENEQSSELDCSNFVDRRIIENKGTEERTPSPENNPLSSTPSLSSLSSLSDDLLVAELQRRELERLSTAQQELPTNVEKPSKQRNTEPLLIDEEKRIQSYWCQLGFTERPSAKKHWLTLSKHIQSFEQFKSLFKYTEEEILKDASFDNKTVSPGNLANAKYLDGWTQKQRRAELTSQPTKQKPKITKEYLASLPL